MKKFINDLLSDSGRVSSTRFVYVVGHLVIFTLSTFLVLTAAVNTLNMALISIIVGTLNSTKLIQKSQESKNPPEGS
jgi:hypothetical protein